MLRFRYDMCAASVIYNAGRNTQLLKHTQNIIDTAGSVCVCVCVCTVCACVVGGVCVCFFTCVYSHTGTVWEIYL